MPPSDLCGCGQPLHYSNPANRAAVEAIVARLGPLIPVQGRGGAWLVPRHYIALHGLKYQELAHLAARYHWEKLWP